MDVSGFDQGLEREFSSCDISPCVPFGEGTVMFCLGICFYAHLELVLICVRSMNSHYYLENRLQVNARPHVAGQIINYLNTVNIPLMESRPQRY